jgi:hypothetical protein
MMFRKSFFITTCIVDILPNEPAVLSGTINNETRFKENGCVRRVKIDTPLLSSEFCVQTKQQQQ